MFSPIIIKGGKSSSTRIVARSFLIGSQSMSARCRECQLRYYHLPKGDVKAAFQKMNPHASPGPDGWRTLELKQLLDVAIAKVTQTLANCEHQQQLPYVLLQSWGWIPQLHMGRPDESRAFPSVNRRQLWMILGHAGVDQWMDGL